jgi:hypothetical protein
MTSIPQLLRGLRPLAPRPLAPRPLAPRPLATIRSRARDMSALALLATLVVAQEPMSKEPPKAKAAEPVKYLDAWPKPQNADTLKTDIERLIKVRTPEMGVQARQALIADGASAVPFLMDKYGKEKDPDAARRMREVLVEITKADQTRLLAKHFEKPSAAERTFALWRCAAFPDKELAASAEKAFANVEKQADKADPEEKYAAALCVTSTGSLKGLDMLYTIAANEWGKRAVELRAALNGIRGPEPTKIIVAKLQNSDRKQKVAVLHVLSGCGDKSAVPYVRPFLDDDDNSIRVAAINAMRGIVDGDPPVEQLSVFEAIEMAKAWKAKL